MKKSIKSGFTSLGLMTLGVVGLSLGLIDPVMAQGLNTITGNAMGQVPGVTDVLSGAAYIGGVAIGIKAALKFKEHNDSNGQVKLSAPMTMAVVSALLIALPSFLTVGTEAVFGSGNQKVNTSAGTLRSVR